MGFGNSGAMIYFRRSAESPRRETLRGRKTGEMSLGKTVNLSSGSASAVVYGSAKSDSKSNSTEAGIKLGYTSDASGADKNNKTGSTTYSYSLKLAVKLTEDKK